MSSTTELRLLTLLNVSAIKRPFDRDEPGGHKRGSLTPEIETSSKRKQNGRPPRKKAKKGVVFGGEIGPSGSKIHLDQQDKQVNGKTNGNTKPVKQAVVEAQVDADNLANWQAEEESEDEAELNIKLATTDPFISHFENEPKILSSENIAAADASKWSSNRIYITGFGHVSDFVPEGAGGHETSTPSIRITPSILSTFEAKHAPRSTILSSTVDMLSSYKDVFVHGLDGEATGIVGSGPKKSGLWGKDAEDVRSAAIMHSVNHVLKTGRKITRNNEKLAHMGTPPPEFSNPRDQSFTRPKVLFLLPFRSLALHYLQTHLFPLAPEGTQIENLKPFLASFGLPDNVTDPLADPEKAKGYPSDHIATFSGNSDDNFRFGIKFTRKAWRVILPPANEEKLIGCDIIVASPLAIRMAADKENGTDSLSGIEICVADGLDVMAMQNWDHVKFTIQNMNKMPGNTHGFDVTRVKEWYLQEQARNLRQTILLSRYETPEMRSLFNKSLYNVAGKIRVERSDFEGVLGHVRKGVKQVFSRLKGEDGLEELEVRFNFFVKETLPFLIKSAVCSTNTLIVIPSYFDFVRVTNHMRKMDKVSFAAISEYSSNQEISSARTSFFKGKKSFLVITERFHFYKRYRLRGAKTIVFYSLPEHAQFYPELMASPFLPSATGKQTIDISEEDVSSRVAFSKFDFLKLERIVGTESARRMVTDDESKFTFV